MKLTRLHCFVLFLLLVLMGSERAAVSQNIEAPQSDYSYLVYGAQPDYEMVGYRINVAEAQRPWLIGSSILLFCVLTLITILFVRTRRSGKRLENLVEKRTHELELQTSMLMTIFDSTPDFIFCKDLNLNYIRFNKSIENFFNVRAEDIIGKNAEEAFGFSPERMEVINREDNYVISEKRPLVFEENLTTQFGGKKETLVETIKAPLIRNGEVIGLMGISRDITNRKEMESKIASNYEYAGKLSNALASITKSPAIYSGLLKDAADLMVKEGSIALNCQRVSIWNATEESTALQNISSFDLNTGEHSVQADFDLINRQLYAKLIKSERLINKRNQLIHI